MMIVLGSIYGKQTIQTAW